MIEVEAPSGGDPVRAPGAIRDGISWLLARFNRNKESLTLDLYQDEGRAVLADLPRRPTCSSRRAAPGVLSKMGFDEARLRALDPAFVVASVNGYGSSGPMWMARRSTSSARR